LGFEPTISAGERPQTYALDLAATGTGTLIHIICKDTVNIVSFETTSPDMAINGQVEDIEMASVFISKTCTWHTVRTAAVTDSKVIIKVV
jgi:hypothetical protein